MPAYNAERTIGSAVRSTLRALPRDSELVVMDDASTDDTLLKLEPLSKDKRLTVVASETNRGVSECLNSLLGGTDSEYVSRMDADDLTLPLRFAVQAKAIEIYAADILFGTALFFGRRWIRPQLPFPISAEGAPLSLLLGNPFVHSSMFARRRSIEALGGYRSVASEDYDLWLRAAVSGQRLVRIPVATVAYRQHEGQVTAQAAWMDRARYETLTKQSHLALEELVFGRRFGLFGLVRGFTEGTAPRDQRKVLDQLESVAGALSWVERAGVHRQLTKVRTALQQRTGDD